MVNIAWIYCGHRWITVLFIIGKQSCEKLSVADFYLDTEHILYQALGYYLQLVHIWWVTPIYLLCCNLYLHWAGFISCANPAKQKGKNMENIPEKFLNKDGTLNTDALLKSYIELEKKIGTMVSVPDSNSDDASRAKFNRAIGVPESSSEYPTNQLFDDEELREKFFEIGLTSTQVEKIYQIAEEFLSPVLTELFDVQNESNAIAELKNFFGTTEKMNDALRAINTFGQKYLPRDAFDILCSTPQGIQGVYKMMQSMEPTVHTDDNDIKNLSDAELRRMMRDPKYWRDYDPEYVRKIENGFKKLYS